MRRAALLLVVPFGDQRTRLTVEPFTGIAAPALLIEPRAKTGLDRGRVITGVELAPDLTPPDDSCQVDRNLGAEIPSPAARHHPWVSCHVHSLGCSSRGVNWR
jgi:hypothetical protein